MKGTVYRYKTLKSKVIRQMRWNGRVFQRRHVCRLCGYYGWQPIVLQTHIAHNHTDSKAFKCEYCGKGFYQDAHLRIHKRIHTGEKPYTCETCKKGFADKSAYDVHLRMHSGEKKYVCEDCGKRYAYRSSLVLHQRVHNGDKPFKCPDCGTAFSDRANMKRHQQVHSDARPHRCTICPQRFKRAHTLMLHMRMHSGERPYACPYEHCDDRFTRQHHLKGHISALHTPEGQARQKKQEQRVARILTKNCIDYKREHHIRFQCFSKACESKQFARIDFVLQVRGAVIFLEIDENQHRFGSYSVGCDMKRMGYVMQALAIDGNTLPIVFLRYNPQGFKVDGVTKRTLKKEREKRLLQWLDEFEPNVSQPLSIVYMFYDTVVDGGENIATVTLDPDYHDHMAECVTDVIFEV